MKHFQQVITSHYQQQALTWILSASEAPQPLLEPEFDITDDDGRYAKKIRNLSEADPSFWQQWFQLSGLNALVGDHLSRPKLLRHAAFIKRHADESYIPLHQDIALWEKAYESAVTFWIALTPSRNENGGMFYCRSAETIYPHEFNLQYPMFKCIDVEKNRIPPESIVDAPLEAGDVLVWPARTPHGSYMNTSGQLRIGMPVVFVDESEYQKLNVRSQ
ncbi:Phytanoyl-CoA dioxygenase (PhyH) [Serratia rubidaea]|uniref:Phytanoyl-CoA dioxygenase (PhyH) n=1 Tax=Serratia rubidaea TaxID=61652 RepID=A0A447QT59_SERRU|nr:phytanoyl-CoA dioxygenase family protein [Serratia rubidaea]MBD8451687.1 phytanoyl-CoA dioxygenase family protein [Serratia rubidaea]MBS0972853.1 phytanoyl-CoA dioxygenase family protein [Serratia rubidaea]MCR0998562.1 phytanoyl-CoA dioxygenase family protein [Serratia rubidaea]MDC6111224.1 phytanoyl-CoA dioxygenase family protein [Serratia rubidaea]QPR62375.1 phytanoyl-CoA dioxygenase family protein [Serratia rubidaea]